MQVTELNLQDQTTNNVPRASAAKTALPDQMTKAKATATPKEDTAELSLAAQVLLLYQEGNSVSEIAAKLKIDVKTVESYLPGNFNVTEVQQPYGPALQTTAASQSSKNTGKTQTPAQAESKNAQLKTVAQNGSEPSSYAKTINRLNGAGSTVVSQ
jgi:DNA-binding CsgD family transcriptional regulator